MIQIIDHKKNTIKLKGGDYMAVENMENAFLQSPACVVANGGLVSPL